MDSFKLSCFPKLDSGNFKKTSDETDGYNCVAWVFADQQQWWQPMPFTGKLVHWPLKTPTLVAFPDLNLYLEMFEKHGGFSRCQDGVVREGFQKIAVYYDDLQMFTHVAKQKPCGMWTSKLGDWEDIDHVSPDVLFSQDYGNKVVFMERPFSPDLSSTGH